MRKILSLLLCLPLALLCAPALAQDLEDLGAMDTATGAVEAARTVDVTAPFSGVLLPFDVEAGDRVEAGEALLCMDTTKVYAPFDGTLSAVFAAEGDDADAFTARYGGLASLEPAERLTLDCTAYGAYDDAEHKIVHVGETLYYKNATGDKVTGTGRVVAVTAEGFQVEVLTGEPEVGQRVDLYRDADHESDERVGRGACRAATAIPIAGTGRVLRVHAQEGAFVRAGDLLFELVGADAAPQGLSDTLCAPEAGVVTAVPVADGQQVYKGQVLLTLADEDSLRVTAEVDEMDLGAIAVGDRLSVVFDRYPDTVYEGTVTSISAQGVVRQNASYYTVKLDVDAPGLLLGMSATVYLPR